MLGQYLQALSDMNCSTDQAAAVAAFLEQQLPGTGKRQGSRDVYPVFSTPRQQPVRIAVVSSIGEPGLLVGHSLSGGYRSLEIYGEVDPDGLNTQEVMLHGREDLYAVVGIRKEYWSDEAQLAAPAKPSSFYLDTGLGDEELDSLVSPGDFGEFIAPYVVLNNKRAVGKGLGAKAGTAVLLEGVRDIDLPGAELHVIVCDRYARGRGELRRKLAALDPHAVVIVDTADTGEGIQLGKGPVLNRGDLVDHTLTRRAAALAETMGISLQTQVQKVSEGGGYHFVFSTGGGCPCVMLGIPLSDRGLARGIVSLSDASDCAALLRECLKEIGGGAL